MNFLKKLLSENSDVSAMRFMSIISLLVGSTIAIIATVWFQTEAVTPLVSVFVGAAFGGKVWQKYAENGKQ